MPLSELYRMAKEKLGSTHDKNNTIAAADLSSNPDSDIFELVWDNGQILMQGQSSRTRKNSSFSTSQSQWLLPSESPRVRDRDVGHFNNGRMGKFGAIEFVERDVRASVPSPEVDLTHDDDMVPWLNYPLDGNLQLECSSDFLPELSGVTVNDHSTHNTVCVSSSIDKGSDGGNQIIRDTRLNSLHVADIENGSISKLSSLVGSETAKPRSCTNQLYASASQECETSFPHFRTKNTTGKAHQDAISGLSPHVLVSAGNSSSTAKQKLDPAPSSNSSNFINFSHFLRPAALSKPNLQNHGMMPMGTTGLSSMRSLGSRDRHGPTSQPPESLQFGIQGSIRKESNSHCHNAEVPSIDDNNLSETKHLEISQATKQAKVASLDNLSKNDDLPKQYVGVGATKVLSDSEKAVESVIAASICSRNSMDEASDEAGHNVKRKCHDTEDSECHSDDVEEESIDVKRATPARGTSCKRSRAAEVHNLSERRRRDRINEKMRALQELIPNCNKVDKASMLDEAIEYLKTLQLQVQLMSMGASLFMPPMMFPGGMQPVNTPHMAHYLPMGARMGMGFGMGLPTMNGGSPGYPTIQVPHMRGSHFPGQSIPGQTVMHGMPGSNFQVLGLPGQGLPTSLPMPLPHAPIAPFSGGPFMTNPYMAVAATENVHSVAASSSKDLIQKDNSPTFPNGGIGTSISQAPKQADEQASCVNAKPVNSTNKTDIIQT